MDATAKLVGALFQHGDARPTKGAIGDPDLHLHAVLFNMGRSRNDGCWAALNQPALFRAKMLAGAVYHAELSAGLCALGFSIDPLEGGLFEVAGVAKELVEHFSKRRHELEQSLHARGIKGTKGRNAAIAAAVTRRERASKDTDGRVDRNASWRRQAEALGVAPTRVVQTAMAVRSAGQKASAEELVGASVDALFTTEAAVNEIAVLAAATRAVVGTTDADGAQKVLRNMEMKGPILRIGTDPHGHSVFSTPGVIECEMAVGALASSAALDRSHVGDPVACAEWLAVKFPGSSDEQRRAAVRACTAGSVFVAEGAAGAGKTYTMGMIAGWYRERKYDVLPTATGWFMARALGKELGAEGIAVAKLLKDVQTGQRKVTSRTLIVVDEAAQIGAAEVKALLELRARSGAKLVMTGDQRQTPAIGASPGARLVAEKVGSVRLEKARRNREPWVHEAWSDLSHGRNAQALGAYRKHGHAVLAGTSTGALELLAGRWCDAWDADNPHDLIFLVRTNQEKKLVDRRLRHELQVRGLLPPDAVVIRASLGDKHASDLPLAVGERVRFGQVDHGLGVVNGDIGMVEAVVPAGDGEAVLTVRIKNKDGKKDRIVTVDTRRYRNRRKDGAALDAAWSSTVWSAQGSTVERAFVLGSATMSREELYVAMSRTRGETIIAFDRRAVQDEILAGRGLGSGEITDDEVWAHIGKATSRSRGKFAALDYDGARDWATQRSCKVKDRRVLERVQTILDRIDRASAIIVKLPVAARAPHSDMPILQPRSPPNVSGPLVEFSRMVRARTEQRRASLSDRYSAAMRSDEGLDALECWTRHKIACAALEDKNEQAAAALAVLQASPQYRRLQQLASTIWKKPPDHALLTQLWQASCDRAERYGPVFDEVSRRLELRIPGVLAMLRSMSKLDEARAALKQAFQKADLGVLWGKVGTAERAVTDLGRRIGKNFELGPFPDILKVARTQMLTKPEEALRRLERISAIMSTSTIFEPAMVNEVQQLFELAASEASKLTPLTLQEAAAFDVALYAYRRHLEESRGTGGARQIWRNEAVRASRAVVGAARGDPRIVRRELRLRGVESVHTETLLSFSTRPILGREVGIQPQQGRGMKI